MIGHYSYSDEYHYSHYSLWLGIITYDSISSGVVYTLDCMMNCSFKKKLIKVNYKR